MADDMLAPEGGDTSHGSTDPSDESLEPVVVNVDDLEGAVTEGVEAPQLWDGWQEADRNRVEYLFATGLRQLREEPREQGIMLAPDEAAASLLLSMTAELAQDGVVGTRRLDSGAAEATFDERDLGWTRVAMGWLKARLDLGRFDWRPPAEQSSPLPDDCRLAILGDWGTGLYGAPKCGESIAGDTEGFDLVMHVGDVYYSGTKREINHNFLAVWPWQTRPRSAGPVVFRACNSNHEMYSGGKPYVEQTLSRFAQDSSVFALENKRWLLVGLDTAYDEWKLAGGQADWLRRLLSRDDGRRAILFSHHQPFSLFSPSKGTLRNDIDKVVAAHRDKIVAWYWGHEHLCGIYDRYPPWGIHGRCVGHSGFPYFRAAALRGLSKIGPVDTGADEWLVKVPGGPAPGALILDGPNRFIGPKADQRARYGPNGYMTVHLHDDAIAEEVRSSTGQVLWRGTISVA